MPAANEKGATRRLTLKQFREESGVSNRTLARWMRMGLLPGPRGAARASYYDATHVIRARAIAALSRQRVSLRAIRDRLAVTGADELAQLAGMATAATHVAAVSFPRSVWEVVELSASLVLLVRADRPSARGEADEL